MVTAGGDRQPTITVGPHNNTRVRNVKHGWSVRLHHLFFVVICTGRLMVDLQHGQLRSFGLRSRIVRWLWRSAKNESRASRRIHVGQC